MLWGLARQSNPAAAAEEAVVLALQLEATARPSKSAAAVLVTSAAPALAVERAAMLLEAAGDCDEAARLRWRFHLPQG